MEFEQLQAKLSEALVQLQPEQLHEVCLQAKIETVKPSKKYTLIRLINQRAEKVIESEEEDVARTFLLKLITCATEAKQGEQSLQIPAAANASQDAEALTSLQKQYAALQES